MSWKPEVKAGELGWTANGLAFATELEAEKYVGHLAMRWSAVKETRVVESEEPVNYSYIDGKLESVDAAPGESTAERLAEARRKSAP